MDPQVIAALRAQGMSDAQIMQILVSQSAPAAAAAPNDLSRIRNAPMPIQRTQTLSHPKEMAYTAGQRGQFDGEYVVTVVGVARKSTPKGNVNETLFTIDESTNPLVAVGSTRSHEIWENTPAGCSEANGHYQALFDAKGGMGQWTADFFTEATGERQSCKGLRFRLSVSTRPQKGNSSRCFTDHRYSPMAAGEVAGLAAAPAPAVNPFAGLQLPAGFPSPQFPGQTTGTPVPVSTVTVSAPAPAPNATGLPPTPPANWPAGLKWPGAL